jgi:hypothetical protein
VIGRLILMHLTRPGVGTAPTASETAEASRDASVDLRGGTILDYSSFLTEMSNWTCVGHFI